MRVMITGATGFVGFNLLNLVLERGFEAKCLVRPGNEKLLPKDFSVTIVPGDLTDYGSVRSCAEGCRAVFHVAADYRLWTPDPDRMFAINVDGTKNVLKAAKDAGVERVVHTSTVGALGIPSNGGSGDENTPVTYDEIVSPYKRSKYLAEQAALQAAENGQDVVVVNPSTPVGPDDRKPTPTGQVIVDFLNRKMPAYIDTGLNIIHVRDTVEGHLLALERGKRGEKYILGCENLTLKEILRILSDITGLGAPKVRLPRLPVLWLAYLSDAWSRLVTHSEPFIPLEGVRMAAKKMFFDASKAVRELGLPQTPAREALKDAVDWYRENGYVKK